MQDAVEPLLRSNRRTGWLLVAVSSLPLWFGLGAFIWGSAAGRRWILAAGGILAVVGLVMVVRQLVSLRRPRVALVGDSTVRLFLGRGCQYEVPLEVVECFFLGQAPSHVRVAGVDASSVGSVTVVVRLAQRAKDWHTRPTDPHLATWDDGYVTILGDWCEPIDGDFVVQMNQRLAAVKRGNRQTGVATE